MSASTESSDLIVWVWAGALLVASAVLPFVLSAGIGLDVPVLRSTVGILGELAFAAAMVLFAWGWRGRGSVVAGRRAGVIALTALAVVPLAMWLASGLADLTLGPLTTTDDARVWWGDAYQVLWIGAAALAVAEIWRAGVVPRPWNRVPAWGLLVVVGVGAITQIASVSLVNAGAGDQLALITLWQLSSLAMFVVPLGLGIAAIVLGLRRTPPPTVQVFPPAA
ncbi:hypothetical protein [Microbacterium sp. TNHR37B]|uniref:hypothetical protein n=1 Tax=Microbacterium sp. TNHR37B TaxID=1775956 RepID=UPI0007B23BB1|nr:hypothetical protein [Microbacterium sp. TNHR37B]KZE89167.1 hypothetical protein AVP41_01959 [Microbacterium sp. TNHR37B]